MSTKYPVEKSNPVRITFPRARLAEKPSVPTGGGGKADIGSMTSVLVRSEGHPVNRKTGVREGGGPFSVYHTGAFCNPGHVTNAYNPSIGVVYTGPVIMAFPLGTPLEANYKGKSGIKFDDSSLNAAGATAIARCGPTNATANLAVTMAETFREGIPSLPGIQSWKKRTEILRAAGSEYLNYQFGWHPLHSEIKNVGNAARKHRDLLQNYKHNEGRPVHRSFHFPEQKSRVTEDLSDGYPFAGGPIYSAYAVPTGPAAKVQMSLTKTTRTWFEGCFTYGGPSKLDKFRRHLGFGSDADILFNTTLTPEVLWNLTPWSWAVDWFTNAGDVISNIGEFGMAGLVMRYGFMMSETIETLELSWGNSGLWQMSVLGNPSKGQRPSQQGSGSRGFQTVTKTRVPANPFGFGVSWEGLSPTQLAITAAIGITRFKL